MCSELAKKIIKTNNTIMSNNNNHISQNSEISFTVKYYQYLDQDGNLINLDSLSSSQRKKLDELLEDKEHLLKLYKSMALARCFDNKAVALQRTGRMGTYPSALGQEAISIAMADGLTPDDAYVPYYRDVSGMIMRGVRMEEILLYWGGDERGSDYQNPTTKNDFPICVPIATQYLHATGVAAAFKYRKQKNVAITAIGDGGTSKGDFYEALNLAGTWNLPVVFVINNNQWAISVPRKKQSTCRSLAQKGIAAGINSIQIDGNDMIALAYHMKQAIDHARSNKGPTLIEAITYRMGDHTTADDATRYRSQSEVDEAAQKDPIKRLYNYLLNKNFWSASEEKELNQEVSKKVEQAVESYLNTPPAPATSMFDNLFEQLPEAYLDQYNELNNLK